jgi:hypothetical protein
MVASHDIILRSFLLKVIIGHWGLATSIYTEMTAEKLLELRLWWRNANVLSVRGISMVGANTSYTSAVSLLRSLAEHRLLVGLTSSLSENSTSNLPLNQMDLQRYIVELGVHYEAAS